MMRRIGIFWIGVLISASLLYAPAAVMAIDFQVPGTSTKLNVGGYVKLDVVYNDVSAGDDLESSWQYAPGAVPLDNSNPEKDEVILNARESRLWVKTSTPTDLGPLKTHFEMDFDTADSDDNTGNQVVSNSSRSRIRHAYGELDRWLFGQTWSLFMHLNSLPELNDFGGPTGTIFARQPQVRYTFPINDKMNVAISIENPETYYDSGSVVQDDGPVPDVIGRFNWNPSWGNLSGAALIRQLNVDEGTTDDTAMAWGAQVGVVVNIGPNDNVKSQFTFGEGVGRYSSLGAHFDAVLTAGGTLEPLEMISGFVGYEHKWGGPMNCRSNILVGYTKADDPIEINTTDNTETTNSIHLNTFFNPVPAMRVGLEIIRGHRETYDNQEGTLNRVQFSTMFVF